MVPVLAAHVSEGSRRRRLPGWLRDAQRVDVAVYSAITQTPTPSLDLHMSRLTQAADYSRLWLGSAVILAATRGARGRRAALTGLGSIAVTSAVANLMLKPLGRRRRPDASNVPVARQAPMPAKHVVPVRPLGLGLRLRDRGRQRAALTTRSRSGRSLPWSPTPAFTPVCTIQPTPSPEPCSAPRSRR